MAIDCMWGVRWYDGAVYAFTEEKTAKIEALYHDLSEPERVAVVPLDVWEKTKKQSDEWVECAAALVIARKQLQQLSDGGVSVAVYRDGERVGRSPYDEGGKS